MYIEAVCRSFDLPEVPENKALRKEYEHLSLEVLIDRLKFYGPLHNTTDIQSRKRLIRAIEIAEYRKNVAHNISTQTCYPKINPYIIGLYLSVEERHARIDRRLEARLQNGMIEEAERLMKEGLTLADMTYYGLEYKYLALYLTGSLSFEEMKQQLRIAIHQFAKRQMTWFRGMERRGLRIRWIAKGDDAEIVKELMNHYM